MKTFDEEGNIVSDTPDILFPRSLQKHAQLLQHLHGLHSQIVATPVNKVTVLTACGLAAAIGVAWWLNTHQPAIDYEDTDEDDNEQL